MGSKVFCGSCGQLASEGEAFCVACGQRLRQPTEAPSEAPATQDASSREDAIALRHALDLLASRQAPTALTVLSRLVAERPDWAIARAYLGIAYLRTLKIPEARDELEAAVRLAPESFICRAKYAEFLSQLGFYDQAMNQLDLALAHTAPDGDSRYAAMELRQFCKDNAKSLYYREFRYPRLPLRKLLPGRVFQSRSTQISGGSN